MKKVTKAEIIIVFVFIATVSISGIFFIKQKKEAIRERQLIPGDIISELNLFTEDNESFDNSVLQSDSAILIFILPTPCYKCNKNIALWRNLVKIF